MLRRNRRPTKHRRMVPSDGRRQLGYAAGPPNDLFHFHGRDGWSHQRFPSSRMLAQPAPQIPQCGKVAEWRIGR